MSGAEGRTAIPIMGASAIFIFFGYKQSWLEKVIIICFYLIYDFNG